MENDDGKQEREGITTEGTKADDRLFRSMATITKLVEKQSKELEEIKKKEQTPIEARVTRLEGRIAMLESLLTEETPTGKMKKSQLGKKMALIHNLRKS